MKRERGNRERRKVGRWKEELEKYKGIIKKKRERQAVTQTKFNGRASYAQI